MKDFSALKSLIERTDKKIGFRPSSPSEFDELSSLIDRQLGKSLSSSSLKRMWGYVKHEGNPSVTTLNILAKFNGFDSWKSYLQDITSLNSEDSAFLVESTINTHTLTPGDRLAISWGADKKCNIICIDRMRFRVEDSVNIKLLPGDTFTLHTLCVGHPIYVSDIHRGETRIPAYIGAKKGGLLVISLFSKTN